jgi:two-component system chemotaxis response regulator CheB
MIGIPESLKPFLLLSNKHDHHYIIDPGVFVVLEKTTSVGFFINNGNHSEIDIQNSVKSALKALNTDLFSEIKLIGDEHLSLKIQPLLTPFGPIKIVPKSGPHEIIFSPIENRTRIAPVETLKPVNIKTEIKTSNPFKKVKVLIVDDSKTIRILLKKVFAKSEQIEIIEDTGDPLDVIRLIKEKKPDVITLDIHMPKMDGLTLLKKYIPDYPIPTVMISSVSMEDGPTVLNALEAGAVDYIKKPELEELTEAAELIIEKVLSAASSKVTFYKKENSILANSEQISLDTNAFIAIGASTGGTEALRTLLTQLPAEIPPILIVQHIPAGFSNAFAKRLDSLCPFEVLEAQNNDTIVKNRVLIAPGGKQMRAVCQGRTWHVVIEDTPPVNRHKPSVDHLFNSLVQYDIKNAVGIILTGMGGDGAKGLLNLKNKGWMTIAQDKESCVVFGMPSVAIDLGAAQHVCNLKYIPSKIHKLIPAK